MKIAFPVETDNGMESIVYGHFGTARFFILIDPDKPEPEVLPNQDLNHSHGKCQPILALGGRKVDAVVVGGIGGGALRKLSQEGITVFRAVEGTVADNLALIRSGKLPRFSMDQTCAGHTTIGGCSH
ncbi:MAG: NifB/NifX family molybdenum-iron cluster-binding protein [Thermodesulfobacteriota bacterium]